MNAASSPTPRKPELRSLTGLRFLAALHVLVFHALFTFNRSSLLLPRGALRSLLSSGYVGVNLFFVLSGFVLAYAYVEDGRMVGTVGRFWRARFARIYPLHVAGVLAALPLFVLGSRAAHASRAAIMHEGATELGMSALLVQAWFPAHVLDLNGPSWSLSVEAFFYVLFPLLVRLLAPLRGRGLLVAAIAAWGAALAPPLLHRGPANVLAPATSLDHVLLYDPLVRLPDFIVGVVAGLLFLRFVGSKRSWSWTPAVATTAFVLVLVILAASERLPFALLHNGLLDPLWALLLFALAARKDERRGIARALFVRGGEASYALYVLHKPLYFWLTRLFKIGPLPPAGFLAAYVAGSVALALIAWRIVEEPLRKLLLRGVRSG